MNLGELIRTHKGARSYDQLAKDGGGVLTSQRLQQMATSTRIAEFPKVRAIRSIAQALRVSESAVVLAAAESLGLDVRSSMPRLVELLPAQTDQLSEPQAAAVAHLVETIVRPAVYINSTASNRRAEAMAGEINRRADLLVTLSDGHQLAVEVKGSGAVGGQDVHARVDDIIRHHRSAVADVMWDAPYDVEVEWIDLPALEDHLVNQPQKLAARSGQSVGRGLRTVQDEAETGSQDVGNDEPS